MLLWNILLHVVFCMKMASGFLVIVFSKFGNFLLIRIEYEARGNVCRVLWEWSRWIQDWQCKETARSAAYLIAYVDQETGQDGTDSLSSANVGFKLNTSDARYNQLVGDALNRGWSNFCHGADDSECVRLIQGASGFLTMVGNSSEDGWKRFIEKILTSGTRGLQLVVMLSVRLDDWRLPNKDSCRFILYDDRIRASPMEFLVSIPHTDRPPIEILRVQFFHHSFVK
jgi:hypothetical protein